MRSSASMPLISNRILRSPKYSSCRSVSAALAARKRDQLWRVMYRASMLDKPGPARRTTTDLLTRAFEEMIDARYRQIGKLHVISPCEVEWASSDAGRSSGLVAVYGFSGSLHSGSFRSWGVPCGTFVMQFVTRSARAAWFQPFMKSACMDVYRSCPSASSPATVMVPTSVVGSTKFRLIVICGTARHLRPLNVQLPSLLAILKNSGFFSRSATLTLSQHCGNWMLTLSNLVEQVAGGASVSGPPVPSQLHLTSPGPPSSLATTSKSLGKTVMMPEFLTSPAR